MPASSNDGDGTSTPNALEGVTVLDFTRHLAGPYATVFLSDFGADIIKIEALPGGDGSREIGVAFVGDQSAVFLMWNRGKRSVALDLRDPKAIEVIHRLIPSVDVVIENFRPGVADEIGIGYETLSELNERLLYVSVSAFGEGPLAPYPGTDPVVQAMSGIMSVTGEPDGGPVLVGIPVADYSAAMSAVQAVLLGLLARDRTGRGQKLDVSMLYTLISSWTTRLASYWATGEEPRRHGSEHSVVAPYQAFKTADGYAVAGVWGGDGWDRFCEALGRPELVDDDRFVDNVSRVKNRTELTDIVQSDFVRMPTSYWQERFNRSRALFGPVLSFSEVLSHPHVEQSGIVQTVEHPTLGEIPQLGPVIFMSDTPGRISGPPPLLGQHTRQVLGSAGYSPDEVSALLEEGIAFGN